jgi:hypothetical protein
MKGLNFFIRLKRFVIKHWPLGPKLWLYFLINSLLFGLLPVLFVKRVWFSTFFLIWILVYLFIVYFISYLITEQTPVLIFRQIYRRRLARYNELDAILFSFYYLKLFIWLAIMRAAKAGVVDIVVGVCVFFILVNSFSLYVFLIRERASEHYWTSNLWDYRAKK